MNAGGERVFVAMGANLGSPAEQLDGALAALRELDGFDVTAVSSWHRTAPVGGPPGQPDYANGVVEGRSRLEPEALLDALLAIEARFGRVRTPGERNAPRRLDLDLLLFGERHIDAPNLTVPHPRMEDRAFVLAPLAELAPDLVLPKSRKTVARRLAELAPA